MPSERELFLIDGNSLAYRAYYALPDSIATSRGEPTNAIFGFASMLVKILTEYGPKATIVVWDAGMSGREVQYEPYKAERKPRPDLLREQWPHLEPLVESFGYPNVRVEGYEADDVIASLAEQAKQKGIDVTVVTGDRDAYQLVDDGQVRIMTTSRGITDTRVYDREGVIERYGIPPELIPDFIGLKGDTSDNIPGVPGIGDKPAAQLLQEFRSLGGVRAARVAGVAKLRGEPLAIAVRPPEAPEGALFVEGTPWRYGAYTGGAEALAGECAGPAELVEVCGERPVAVHDAKSLGTVPP